MSNADRRRKILALYGKKSFGLIARELGITRNIVAGTVFRSQYPSKVRVSSPNGSRNKIGVGHHGPGCYARKTLRGSA
jgi:hypothetical protein